MSIALVVTRGYGNGTFTGTVADVVTRGYTIGIIPTYAQTRNTGMVCREDYTASPMAEKYAATVTREDWDADPL